MARKDGKFVGARVTGQEARRVERDRERLGFHTVAGYVRALLGLGRPDPAARRLRRRRLIREMAQGGMGDEEIARRLGVAPRTVSNEIGDLRREGEL